MANQLERFVKRKNYLIFVDSDGCAMDTMERKHTQCFGPGLVDEWGLERGRGLILSRWNEINLYTTTRGINRFEGLAMILREISEAGYDIPGLDDLLRWTSAGGALNHRTLQEEIERTNSICLKKALLWSRESNRQIALLPKEDRRPFEGVQRALARAHRYADVAVISNAPLATVLEEWDMYGLLEHTDIVLAEDCGSKERCIAGLLEMGYYATEAGYMLAKKEGIDMPITCAMYDLLYRGKPVQECIQKLMERPRKSEIEDIWR